MTLPNSYDGCPDPWGKYLARKLLNAELCSAAQLFDAEQLMYSVFIRPFFSKNSCLLQEESSDSEQ